MFQEKEWDESAGIELQPKWIRYSKSLLSKRISTDQVNRQYQSPLLTFPQALTSFSTRKGLMRINITRAGSTISGRGFHHSYISRVLFDPQGNKDARYYPKYGKKVRPDLRFFRA